MRAFRGAFLFLLAYPAVAFAGLFSVTPIRVDLSPATKAGSVTISNDGGTLPLRATLMRWTQDANGNDVYESSSDLVYFPRELTVEPGGNRTVRVLSTGPHAAPGAQEQAYRLFLEEGQVPHQAEEGTPHLTVLVKFGVAVYTHDGNVAPAFAFDTAAGGHAKVEVKLRNTGTGHAFLKSLTATGATFAGFKPRYLLASAAAPVTIELSGEACSKRSLDVAVDTAEGPFTATLSLPENVCK